jgi:hypothetical protein
MFAPASEGFHLFQYNQLLCNKSEILCNDYTGLQRFHLKYFMYFLSISAGWILKSYPDLSIAYSFLTKLNFYFHERDSREPKVRTIALCFKCCKQFVFVFLEFGCNNELNHSRLPYEQPQRCSGGWQGGGKQSDEKGGVSWWRSSRSVPASKPTPCPRYQSHKAHACPSSQSDVVAQLRALFIDFVEYLLSSLFPFMLVLASTHDYSNKRLYK